MALCPTCLIKSNALGQNIHFHTANATKPTEQQPEATWRSQEDFSVRRYRRREDNAS